MLTDFPVESGDKGADLIGSGCRKTPHVMGETCDVISIPLSKIGHGWDAAGGLFIGNVPFRWNGGFDPIRYFYLFSIRKNHLLSHMSDHFINQKDNGRSEFFREVEGPDRHIITFTNL